MLISKNNLILKIIDQIKDRAKSPLQLNFLIKGGEQRGL